MNLFCFKLSQALQIDIKINVSINNVVKFEVLRTQPFLFNILGTNTSQLSQKPTEQMIFYKEFKCLLSIQINKLSIENESKLQGFMEYTEV